MIVKLPITKPPVVGINKGRTQRERLAQVSFYHHPQSSIGVRPRGSEATLATTHHSRQPTLWYTLVGDCRWYRFG